MTKLALLNRITWVTRLNRVTRMTQLTRLTRKVKAIVGNGRQTIREMPNMRNGGSQVSLGQSIT